MAGLLDLYNRQLHAEEKTKAQQIEAAAKKKGITNPDGSAITASQIENAMRAANNNEYGESAGTGAVVALNEKTQASELYDTTGMKLFTDGAGNNYLTQDSSAFASPSDTLRDLIQQNTGGTDSPYSWTSLSPEAAEQAAKNAPPKIDYGPFGPGWNTGEYSAGLGAQGVTHLDYVTIQAGAGLGGSLTLNLNNGNVYMGGSVSASRTPGAGIIFGAIPDNAGKDSPVKARETDKFLGGTSVGGNACVFGLCVGGNHALGGKTSFEFGVGVGGVTKLPNPGGNASGGYGHPVFTIPGFGNGEK